MTARVLIVDDDADLAESLAEVLSANGCDVMTAAHGQEALERACARDFDIIFMDVRMPVMNGVDSFFAIRAVKPLARVVMMTGFRETVVERALQAGAEGLLHKPFSIDEMLALVMAPARKLPDRAPRLAHAQPRTLH